MTDLTTRFRRQILRTWNVDMIIPSWFDWLALKIPNTDAPGWKGALNTVLALLLITARQVFVPALALLPLVPIYIGLGMITHTTVQSNDPIVSAIVIFVLAACEEAGRYSFARTTSKPARAIGIFTLWIILVETLTYGAQSVSSWSHELLVRAPSMAIHVAAGGALWWALQDRPRRMKGTFLAVVIVHAAFNLATSGSIHAAG